MSLESQNDGWWGINRPGYTAPVTEQWAWQAGREANQKFWAGIGGGTSGGGGNSGGGGGGCSGCGTGCAILILAPFLLGLFGWFAGLTSHNSKPAPQVPTAVTRLVEATAPQPIQPSLPVDTPKHTADPALAADPMPTTGDAVETPPLSGTVESPQPAADAPDRGKIEAHFSALYQKFGGGCQGDLAFTRVDFHFECFGNPKESFSVKKIAVAKVDHNGVQLLSGKKYHFVIQRMDKAAVHALFSGWLNRQASNATSPPVLK